MKAVRRLRSGRANEIVAPAAAESDVLKMAA
jgi:hypothetical protein